MEILSGISKKKHNWHGAYGIELRLRVVKLYLEEGVPISVIQQESGIGQQTIRNWIERYQGRGQEGLQIAPRVRRGKEKLPGAVKEKIVWVKAAHPGFGVRRISQVLRRIFFLPASPETVRRTLQSHQLMSPLGKKARHNITRPRFFERARPNQMWQGDIFTFRLGGQFAYLIGYIDDYSRYITGLDLFRSQTAQNVIEVYRRAVGEYGVPQEMLTDNGRQYVTWRGTSRFAGELAKDRVKHIRSSPHHPMTLGKMERFWKTIFGEFLGRAKFASFEEARERVGWWVRYYNHKRPHQGIGGLCPADRYFEIHSALKKTIEKGIQENILEMALRGKPREPFYMVGRMDGQSVVLQAEKGQLRLTVDGETNSNELIYTLGEGQNEREDTNTGENREERRAEGAEEGAKKEGCEPFWGGAEVPGSAGALDWHTQAKRDMPAICDTMEPAKPLGEACTGGDGSGTHSKGLPHEEPSRVESEASEHAREALKEASEGLPGVVPSAELIAELVGEDELIGEEEGGVGEQQHEGKASHNGDPGGAKRPDNGRGGGEAAWGLTKDLLRVGEEGPEGTCAGNEGREGGPAHQCTDTNENTAPKTEDPGARAKAGDSQAERACQEGANPVRGTPPEPEKQ